MKTFFVSSDIHSFFKEWQTSLNEVGFDKNNEEHVLIILGDLFDRGSEALEVYRFIKSLLEERVILIKGNHEYLYEELLNKAFPNNYDFSNGTVSTFCQIAGYNEEVLSYSYWARLGNLEPYDLNMQTWEEIKKAVKESEITAWIKSDRWKHYYELGKYIFVHSFIPLRSLDLLPGYYIDNRMLEFFPDWRNNASDSEWYDSTWGCPVKLYMDGYFREEERRGKTLVCGHWHTSDFFNRLLYSDQPDKHLDTRKSNPIFISDEFPGLIGIDACTALTRKVNIFVIKENESLLTYSPS